MAPGQRPAAEVELFAHPILEGRRGGLGDLAGLLGALDVLMVDLVGEDKVAETALVVGLPMDTA